MSQVKVDTITDQAGTGAPDFSQGLTIAAGKTGRTKFQQKLLSANITADTVDIASLKFNGLTIGRIYKVTAQAWFLLQGTSSGERGELTIKHNASTIARIMAVDNLSGTGAPFELVAGSSVIFTATATTVTFDFNEGTQAVLGGGGGASQTYSMLEELPLHEVTTDFT